MQEIRKFFQGFGPLNLVNAGLLVAALSAGIGTLTLPSKFLPLKLATVYSQPWFLGLFVVLGVASGLFALRKIFQLLRPSRAGAFEDIVSLPAPHEISIPGGSVAPLEDRASKILLKRGYRLKSEKRANGSSLLAEKNLWGRWASFLIHLGFAAVLLGGFLTFLFAETHHIVLPEGETVPLPTTSAQIRLEKFSIVFHPDQLEVDEYVSRLLVQNGKRTFRDDLKVNRPLQIGQSLLFQKSYQVVVQGLELFVYRHGEMLERIRLKPEELKPLTQAPFVIQVDTVVPDFVRDKKGNVASRTPYFKNPAALISLYDARDEANAKVKVWAFEDLMFHTGHENEEWAFAIQKIRKRYFSGVQVSRDPGVLPAYFGFVLLTFGVFVFSFVSLRQFFFRFTEDKTKHRIRVEIYYKNGKDRFSFEREIVKLKAELMSETPEATA